MEEPKEPNFFRGAIFEIKFIKKEKFRNMKRSLLFDLPSQYDLASWYLKKIKAPVGL